MAIKEKATNQKLITALNANIVGETTTYSSIIDTANYDFGVYFAFAVTKDDSTSFNAVFVVQEGDESNMSDAADVPAAKLVYGTEVALSAVNGAGLGIAKEAISSNKRYVRVKITTTGHGVDIYAFVHANLSPEFVPTAQI